MTRLTDEQLAELARLAGEATPGQCQLCMADSDIVMSGGIRICQGCRGEPAWSYRGSLSSDSICYYCADVATSRDHIWPRSRGGMDVKWNIVPCCTRCNSSKGNRSPWEWRPDAYSPADFGMVEHPKWADLWVHYSWLAVP